MSVVTRTLQEHVTRIEVKVTEPYVRHSVREGVESPDGPYDGVPNHLVSPLTHWMQKQLGARTPLNQGGGVKEYLILKIASRARLPEIPLKEPYAMMQYLLSYAKAAPHTFLNVIEVTLDSARTGERELASLLHDGGSVWTVDPVKFRLVRAVPVTEQLAYEIAKAPGDEASADLQEAWANAYGRAPDPSDAWDHAIKAVEWLLPAVVAPKDESPRLGKLLDIMRMKPEKWAFNLDTTDRDVTSVRTMIAMMGLVWGNPDRHGAGTSRPPTQEEAEAIVRMAVNVVGLLRTGTLRLVS